MLKHALISSMYRIEGDGGALVAKNPAHKMQGRFSGDGLMLESTDDDKWKFSWRLKTIGYGEQQEPVSKGELINGEDQLEIRHDQNLIEWYKNSPAGIEHGFRISTQPLQADRDQPLRLVMALDGDMTATSHSDGLGVTLATSSGEELSYNKLKAWDAEGNPLHSSLRADARQQVFIEVDDAEAVYPITIDPTFAQVAKVIASDPQVNAYFGWSVAIEGNTAVVGAFENDPDGAAYIFVWDGTGWIEQQKLVTGFLYGDSEFGEAVAISGNTIVVGAPDDDRAGCPGTIPDCGAVYVFVRNLTGTTWTLQQRLFPPEHVHNFGQSVSVHENTVAVGAVSHNVAYVFNRTGTTWTQQGRLQPPDVGLPGQGSFDDFGANISLDQDTVVVGAHGLDINGQVDQGAAYIFVRSGSTWSQQQKLLAPGGQAEDHFGGAPQGVSVEGNRVVVGAYDFDPSEDSIDAGALFTFVRSGASWSHEQTLVIPEGSLFNSIGNASLDGDRILTASKEQAHVFERENGVWIRRQKVVASDGSPSQHFGYSTAISGNTFIVGATDDNGDRGAAYFFRLNRPVVEFDGDGKTDISVFRPSTQQWLISASGGGSINTTFGTSTDRLVPADFTGDAKDDVAIWRPSTGEWWILRSEDSTAYTFPFGLNGDTPMINDFDGDGKADAGIYRPSNSTWYVSKSSGGTLSQGFGTSGDIPVAADYDGDAKADLAVFRPTAGDWFVLPSSTGTLFAAHFGNSSDKLVPGDYTGDNKADIAVWRPSTGEWFVLRSEDGAYFSFPFGTSGDLPSPGDYDGDGQYDAAVFRPSTSTWYVSKSTGGILTQSHGTTGDNPLPNSFVP